MLGKKELTLPEQISTLTKRIGLLTSAIDKFKRKLEEERRQERKIREAEALNLAREIVQLNAIIYGNRIIAPSEIIQMIDKSLAKIKELKTTMQKAGLGRVQYGSDERAAFDLATLTNLEEQNSKLKDIYSNDPIVALCLSGAPNGLMDGFAKFNECASSFYITFSVYSKLSEPAQQLPPTAPSFIKAMVTMSNAMDTLGKMLAPPPAWATHFTQKEWDQGIPGFLANRGALQQVTFAALYSYIDAKLALSLEPNNPLKIDICIKAQDALLENFEKVIACLNTMEELILDPQTKDTPKVLTEKLLQPIAELKVDFNTRLMQLRTAIEQSRPKFEPPSKSKSPLRRTQSGFF